eukprot:7456372-Alexandrium_andersonii.AAC.1
MAGLPTQHARQGQQSDLTSGDPSRASNLRGHSQSRWGIGLLGSTPTGTPHPCSARAATKTSSSST